MSSEIKFWNPYTSHIEVEKIYGEKWLRFIYHSTLGKIGMGNGEAKMVLFLVWKKWMLVKVEVRFFLLLKSINLIRVNFLILQKLSKHLTSSFTEN